MRNLHLIMLQEDGAEVRRLFRLWEKLKLRASDYKNHRIFTLRCLHNDLIPSSIRLKLTIKSATANKILRKAEKDLLQTRVKSINYIIDNTSQQIEECRSKLATIISTQRFRECQDFIDKVSEIRFNKVKQRQLNKLNLLINRKEGNITRSPNTNLNNINAQTSNQVNQSNLNNQVRLNTPTPPANALLPPGEGSNSPPATSHPLPVGNALPLTNNHVTGSPPTPAIAHLPPGEGSNSPPTNNQVPGSPPTPAIAHLPPGEGSNSPLATVLSSSEGNSSPSIQAPGSLPSLAIAHLPPGEGSNSLPATVHLPPEGNSAPSSQPSGNFPTPAIAHLPPGEQFSPSNCTPFLGRKQFSPCPSIRWPQSSNCSPSSWGRKQFSPGSHTTSLGRCWLIPG